MMSTYIENSTKPVLDYIQCNNIEQLQEFLGQIPESVRRLIVNHQRESELTPLCLASLKGSLSFVKYLIDCGADVNKISKSGNLPLSYACSNGHLQVVKYICELNVDLNHVSDQGYTYLMISVKHFEVFKYMLTKGVDENKRDKENCTVLDHVLRASADKVLQLLVNHGYDLSLRTTKKKIPIVIALLSKNFDLLKQLLELGENINAVDKMYNSKLIELVKFPELYSVLLSKGLHVNLRRSEHFGRDDTALHLAVIYSNLESVTLLLNAGADVCAKNEDNDTPLHNVNGKSGLEIMRLFVSHGFDINSVNDEGKNILHCLANTTKFYPIQIVDYVVSQGINVNAKDNEEKTALHFAVEMQRPLSKEMIVSLLKNGADFQLKDIDKLSPLYRAALDNNEAYVECIIENADVPVSEIVNVHEIMAATMLSRSTHSENFVKEKGHLNYAAVLRSRHGLDTSHTTEVNDLFPYIQEPETSEDMDILFDVNYEFDKNERIVAIMMAKILGPFHPTVIHCLRNVLYESEFYFREENFEGLQIAEFVYQASESHFGRFHFETTSAANDYLDVYLRMSDLPDEDLISKMIEDCVWYVDIIQATMEDKPLEQNYRIYLQTAVCMVYLIFDSFEKVSVEQFETMRQVLFQIIRMFKKFAKSGFMRHVCKQDYSGLLHELFHALEFHHCVSTSSKAFLRTISAILDTGDEIAKVDEHFNFPLHVYLHYLNGGKREGTDFIDDSDIDKQVISILLKNGNHIDATNQNGLCIISELKKMHYDVGEVGVISLQCLSARAIQRNHNSFRDHVPKHLVWFVQMHLPEIESRNSTEDPRKCVWGCHLIA